MTAAATGVVRANEEIGVRRWFVLLGCFLGLSVAMPAILQVQMGLFLKSVTAEFGWSRTQFSILLSAGALVNAITMPIAGYLVDRFGARRMIAAGVVLGGSSYAALSLAGSFTGFLAFTALAVATGNLASYPAFMSLAQRWFDKHLGLALAITSTGFAAGAGVFSYVIAGSIALHGWRAAFVTVATAALVIGLANVLLLVRDNKGPVPEAERRDRSVTTEDGGLLLGEALRTRDFWLYAAAFGLVLLAVVGCNVHLPALLSDRGASPGWIASIVAIGSAGSLFGRLFTGIMLDRFSMRSVAAVFLIGQAIGFLLLLDGMRWALPAGFLLGAVQGAEIDLLGYVVARRFGRIAYARVFGSCFAVTLIGAIIGPIAMASVFDRTGSYDLGLILLPLLPLIALVMLSIASVTPRAIVSRGLPATD